jgi:AAA domain-containing protein
MVSSWRTRTSPIWSCRGPGVLGHSAPRHPFARMVDVAVGVWLVVGVPAAGKSTVADLLARQFERGVHVRGGQFSRWAVSGWTHPWDEDQNEARRLLDLRYRLSALVATEYCQAGFATVVQDNIFGEDVRTWLQEVTVRPRHLVVLRPTVAVVLERDHARQRELGKVAYRSGETDAHHLDALLATIPRIGLWLDTSTQTPVETVQSILDRRTEARVDSVI